MGLEGTAPGSHGALGAHSKTGGSDRFSALGGSKYTIKFEQSANIHNYIHSYIIAKNIKNAPDIEALKIMDLNALKSYSESIGLKFAKHPEGSIYLITEFGKQSLEAGMALPHNHGGSQMNLLNKGDDIKELKIVDINKVPNEIIYFKPRHSLDRFLAQEPIYQNIDSKPALKYNPQFDYETSFVIGALYDLSEKTKNQDIKNAVKAILGPIEKNDLKKFNIDINNFNSEQYLSLVTLNNNKDIVKGAELFQYLKEQSKSYTNKDEYVHALDLTNNFAKNKINKLSKEIAETGLSENVSQNAAKLILDPSSENIEKYISSIPKTDILNSSSNAPNIDYVECLQDHDLPHYIVTRIKNEVSPIAYVAEGSVVNMREEYIG